MKFRITRKFKNWSRFSLEGICDASGLSIAILGGPIALPFAAGAVVLGRVLGRGIDLIKDEQTDKMNQILQDINRIYFEILSLKESINIIINMIFIIAFGSLVHYLYGFFKVIQHYPRISLLVISIAAGLLWLCEIPIRFKINQKQWNILRKTIT